MAKGDEHQPLVGTLSSVFTSAYAEMKDVLVLPSVRSIGLVLLTCRAALAVFDAVTPLRLVEAGVPKEHLALMSSLLFPVGVFSQGYISGRYFAGGGGNSKPLGIWLRCYLPRLFLGLVSLGLVVTIPMYKGAPGGLPTWLYATMLSAAMVATFMSSTMFVAQMAFYNRVSDPAIGGTYMTMLNTISNLGSAWTTPLAFLLVDRTTTKRCVPRECAPSSGNPLGKLFGKGAGAAAAAAGTCGCDETTVIDGYVVTCVLCLAIGLGWYQLMKGRVHRLQELPPGDWVARAE